MSLSRYQVLFVAKCTAFTWRSKEEEALGGRSQAREDVRPRHRPAHHLNDDVLGELQAGNVLISVWPSGKQSTIAYMYVCIMVDQQSIVLKYRQAASGK